MKISPFLCEQTKRRLKMKRRVPLLEYGEGFGSAMSGTDGGPAGWRPDPEDPQLMRYWDGTKWSAYTHPIAPGARAADYLQLGAGQGVLMPWWQTWYAIIPGLVLCLPLGLIGLWQRPGTAGSVKALVTVGSAGLLLVAVLMPDDSDTTSDTVGDVVPSETAAPSPSEEPVLAAVPAVKGLNLAEAKQALRDAGLEVGAVDRKPSAKAARTVLKQGLRRGDTVQPGTRVRLVVAVPFPRIPGVRGQAKAAAVKQLRKAGFKVRTSLETRSSGKDGVVLTQRPAARTRARPGSIVRIAISDVVPPAPVSEPSNCTPGYSPCLPPASDYDCAGGSGDGPEYSGPVEVSGSDPYDLDRDGDGVACES